MAAMDRGASTPIPIGIAFTLALLLVPIGLHGAASPPQKQRCLERAKLKHLRCVGRCESRARDERVRCKGRCIRRYHDDKRLCGHIVPGPTDSVMVAFQASASE